MTIELCDICGQPMVDVFRDENGKMWGSVSFQEKKYRAKKWFFGDSWTDYLSICGRCRAEIAKRAKPVTRCKDCKWFGELGCAIKVVDETDKPKENDFCSFGERKEEQ